MLPSLEKFLMKPSTEVADSSYSGAVKAVVGPIEWPALVPGASRQVRLSARH